MFAETYTNSLGLVHIVAFLKNEVVLRKDDLKSTKNLRHSAEVGLIQKDDRLFDVLWGRAALVSILPLRFQGCILPQPTQSPLS